MFKNIKKMCSYYKPYKVMFLFDMLCALVSSGTSLIIPLIARHILYDVVGYEYSLASKVIINLLFISLGLIILEFVSNYFMGYYGHMVGAHMEYDMRSEIFNHYQKLSFAFYDNQKIGQLLSRITSDLFDICELLHHGPEDLLISIVKLIGTTIILLVINIKLGLLTLIFIPIMGFIALYFNRKMKIAFKRNRKRIANINETIEDSLSGIRVVKSFANENIEKEKFKKSNKNYVNTKKITYKYFSTYNSLLSFFVSLLLVTVVFGGSLLIFNKQMSNADLIAFFLYLTNLTEPIKKLINFTEIFQSGYAGFDRFVEILSIEPDITDSDNAVIIENVKGDISYTNVSFKYEGDDERVLNNLNLEVKAGDYIAIVGKSGVGKTTMLSLLPRFYDVTEGKITLDGIDIREIKLNSLRSQIGIVMQDVYLFAGTILENIRYGRPDASDEEVVSAAKLANAHEFISMFEDGYYTDIGQRGVKLSGGQKQRISIARVFLKNPSVLIFDEATSALDNDSEKKIQESLDKLSKDRTTFVIAHRLSTIRNAKKIIVLDKEGIVEEGTHKQLMNSSSVYRFLYERGV